MPDVSDVSAILPGEKQPERLLWRGDNLRGRGARGPQAAAARQREGAVLAQYAKTL